MPDVALLCGLGESDARLSPLARSGYRGPMKHPLLRIGTRGSPLALIQARLVRAALAALIPELAEETAVEVVPIVTSGDRVQDRTLEEIGGKGLFTREIEDGLLAGALDLAVHSMKDMPTRLPDGLIIAAFLPREDPRDGLLASGVPRIADLPQGAVVGTAALRRKAQLLHLRPDLVRRDQIRRFESSARDLGDAHPLLAPDGRLGFAWQSQDLNAAGAVGDATLADAEKGRAMVENAATALVALWREMAAMPLETLRRRE